VRHSSNLVHHHLGRGQHIVQGFSAVEPGVDQDSLDSEPLLWLHLQQPGAGGRGAGGGCGIQEMEARAEDVMNGSAVWEELRYPHEPRAIVLLIKE